jgi:hypothetical protein
MLFPEKPITHEHIRQFCAKFNEGIRVEYKSTLDQSVRNRLPKILSSFANSHGGVLVIGVATNNGVPQLPFDGFAEIVREELPLTIENICLQNLDPPIFPKSTVVRSDAAGKIFLIIEVEESGEAPHAIENSTQVYVRTGNASNLHELATVDRIIDLVQRRKEPLELANRLLSRARERAGHTVSENMAYVQVSVCPTYPRRPLCSSQDVWAFVSGTEALREDFIAPNSRHRIPDGLAALVGAQPSRSPTQHQYREVNKFGLLFARDQFDRVPSSRNNDPRFLLNFRTLFETLTKTLVCSKRFYGSTAYAGNLNIQTTLQNVRNEIMVFLPGDTFQSPDDFLCVNKDVTSLQIASAGELKDRWREVLYRVVAEVCWSFWQGNGEFPSDFLRQYLEAASQRLP